MEHILLLILTALGTTFGVPHKLGIYGGDVASPGQFPFIVSLNNPNQFCDGAIINKNWVLTAGHCAIDIGYDGTIRAGTTSVNSGGTEFKVKKLVPHPYYDLDDFSNDIGLIQIDGEFEFSDLVQPVEYIEVGANSTCYVAGWGVTESEETPKDLRFVDLTTISLEECAEIGKGFIDGMYLGEEQVCAGGPRGKGPCFGDYGGPLVCDGKLAGVESYSILPCAAGYPDIYTRPTAYTDWIDQIVNNST